MNTAANPATDGTASTVYAIRPAVPEDADALAALRYEFRASVGEPNEGHDEFVVRCAAWMRERLAPGTPWRAWVAEGAEGIAGCAWLELLEKMPNPVDEPEVNAYLTNVYVRPSARGGVGARLVAPAVAACDAAGVHSAILWPTERSRGFYRRFGFRDHGAVMIRDRPG